jgi:two-component system, NarL family, invasion response regulator UvrY
MTTILIADDQAIARRGLREVLHTAIPDAVLAEAATLDELHASLGGRAWDLLLLEIALAGGQSAELLHLLQQNHPATRVVIVTALPEIEHAISMFKGGAHAYISKQHPTEELVQAVHAVLAGGNYLSDEAMRQLTGAHSGAPRTLHALSSRELAVLRCVAQGRSVKQIAHDLAVSEKTVATYIGRIRNKTGLHNYVDMTRYALKNHLVD